MKKMINNFKAGEKVKTFLGVLSSQQRKARNGKDYLMFKFYDVSGWITGYYFGDLKIFQEIREQHHVAVAGLIKELNGKLILHIYTIEGAKEGEFDKADMFKNVSNEDLKKFSDRMRELARYLSLRSLYRKVA